MYKCTECGQEYNTKPEYCDCGNNEFVLTVLEENQLVHKTESEIIVSKNENYKPEEVSTIKQDNFYTKESRDLSKKTNIEPISLTIFLFCIILSVLIIFVWKVKENPVISGDNINIANEQIKNIPSIDRLWKNNSIKQDPSNQKTSNSNKETQVAKTQKTKTLANTIQKSNSIKNNLTTSKVIKKTSTVKTNTVKNTAAKKQQKETMKQPSKTVSSKAETLPKTTQEAKSKADIEAYAAANAAKKAAANKQEYENYKISLRNAIAKKIDFTKVIGDGSCTIIFKLDSTGKLINRNFAQQSQNITLNNAVYKAMISTPSYNPPPLGYNNQTLRLNISFKNGNFEISLTD